MTSLILLLLSAIPAAYMHCHDHGKLKFTGSPNGFFGSKQWSRKYKKVPYAPGATEITVIPAFWGSTTIFVFVTDAYHASQFIMRALMTTSLVLALSWPWWTYILIHGGYAALHAVTYKLLSR